MSFVALLLVVATVFFGRTVADPYRSLEDARSAQTQAWIDTQNAHADRVLGSYANAPLIAKRVAALARSGSQQYGAQLHGDTLFFMRETPPQPQPVLVAQHWPTGTPRVIVDPSALGSGVSIDEVWPSPSGAYVAIGTAVGGAESTTIRIYDLRRRRFLPEVLGPAGGGTTNPVVAWEHDERAFTYGRLPANGSQFGIALYHHVLGTTQAADTLARAAISPIAEYQLHTSDDARRAAALVQFGDGSPYRVYLRNAGRWKPIVGPAAGIVGGTYVGDDLLVVATGGSLRGRIARVGRDGTLRTIVPEAASWAYHDIAPIRGGFLVTKSWGTAWRVDHYTTAGAFVRTVGLPRGGIGIGGIASSSTQARAIVTYSGWAGPVDRWVSYDAATGALATIFDVPPPSSDYANVRVEEITAISKDGTHVPVTVLALTGTKHDGAAPTILTGYGGFDIATEPRFIGTQLAWLQMGGVLAVANIRGGNEFGEGWHRHGMLGEKQNVFDDFYAAAQALVANGWTSPAHLGIEGGSNGGLLVGASLVQHPHAFRAVIGAAGLYDMLRSQLFPNGAYNVTEYGTTDDAAQFRALAAYSPYHHVTPGTAYPSVLLTTSENDPRVASWQSWKFGAALQHATTSGLPIVVLTRRSGGHGHGESFAQRTGNTAVTLSFAAQQLGAHAPR